MMRSASLVLVAALSLSGCVTPGGTPYYDDPLDDDFRVGIYADYYGYNGGYYGGCYQCGDIQRPDLPDRPPRPDRPDMGPRPIQPIYNPGALPNRPSYGGSIGAAGGSMGAAGGLRGGGGGRRR